MTRDRRLVGTPEAARRVQVDRTTLYRWYQAGQVRPAQVTPGRKVRWDVADLRRQLGMPPEEDTVSTTLTRTTDPVVVAIVTSRAGVLVTRRADKQPPIAFLSGEVEPDEAPADTAVREVGEETGLVVRSGALLGELAEHPFTKRHMIYVAATPTESLDVRNDDTDENETVEWVPSWSALTALIPPDRIFPPVAQHLQMVLPA